MPLYHFKCNDCGQTFEELCKMSECDTFEPINRIIWNKCPNRTVDPNTGNMLPPKKACDIVQVQTTSNICDPVRMGRVKPSSGFRDLMRRIKKANPGSTMKTD